jgi:hypothetical protein
MMRSAVPLPPNCDDKALVKIASDRFHERSVHEGFEQDDRAAEGHGNDG